MVSQLTDLSFLSSSSSSSPSSAGRRQNNNKMVGEKSCGGNGFPPSSSKKQPKHPSNNNTNDKSSIFLTPKVPFPLSVMGACGGGGGGGSSSTSNNDDATPKYDAATTTTTKYETTTTSSVPNSLEFKFEDAQLAKEMNDLSVKEREIRYEDLHGVSQLPEETIEFVNDLIEKLDVQLSKIPQSKRKWLDRAFFLKRCLETDTKFKLMFLRADRYDPYKAAVRMAAFFQSKVELFGEASIVKRITLDDIDPRTVQLSGKWRHVSNYRDQAGRKVLALLPRFTPPDWKENIKFAWYQMYENIVDDEETQIKGIVYVVAASDCNVSPKNFIEYLCLGSQYLLTVPGRYNGFHFCHNHPAFKSVIAMLQYAIGKDHRSRTRVHYGSVLETQYALSTFGIDKRAMPIISNNTTGDDDNESGCFDMNAHQQYLEQQRQRDANYLMEEKRRYKESGGQISYPNPQDVLVGRGRPFQEHIGNIRYLEVVDSTMVRYRNAKDRTEKSTLFRDVINYIHSNGGRFLQVSKDDGHYWIEAPDSTAREKVSHSFRHRPTPAVVPSKSSSTSTSTSSSGTGVGRGGLGGGESLLLSGEGRNGIDGGVCRKSQPQQQQEEEPDFFSKRKRGGGSSSSNGVDPQLHHHQLVPEQQISAMYHQQNKKNTTVFGSI